MSMEKYAKLNSLQALRENALAQSSERLEYTSHTSQHGTTSEEDAIQPLVSLLAEPMSKSGTRRSDADHLAIEVHHYPGQVHDLTIKLVLNREVGPSVASARSLRYSICP